MNKSTRPVVRKLLVRTKIPYTVRFDIRPDRCLIRIFIRVNGVEASGFSTLPDGTTLYVEGYSWAARGRYLAGNSEEVHQFNRILDRIRADIGAVYDRQRAAGFTPTAKSVKEEYRTGGFAFTYRQADPASLTPTACYEVYLRELTNGGLSEKSLKETTLDKWRYGLDYLKDYLKQNTSEQMPVAELTPFWGKSYHRWLMKEGPMSADSATRYVSRLSEALNYMAETGSIKMNPLATLSLPRGKTKEVHFLEPEHLEKFWNLNLPGKTGVACWWMGVIFLTGLDYPDVKRYVLDRSRYEQKTPHGEKIVITRSKSPNMECHIPILPELKALLAQIPIDPIPTADTINDEMRVVEALIGFKHRLTCKIGRKTGGAVFFAEYEDIGAVSRMMGHSSITITERHYVKTTGYTVDKAMRKRMIQGFPSSPFFKSA